MQYSDPSTQQGLLELIRNITKADENTLPETTGRMYLNMALDEYAGLALNSSSNWQFDDTSYDDFPIATADIVSGRYDYEFADSILAVRQVELLHDGVWVKLPMIDKKEYKRVSISEMHDTAIGVPYSYYLSGSSIFLVGTPDYAQANGLKVHYERNMKKFDGTDEQVPGVPSLFHKWLGFHAAQLYAMQENLTNEPKIQKKVDQGIEAIGEFYNRRNKVKRPKLTVRVTPTF